PGMEHWLPLFHDRLDTIFDYLPGTPVAFEPLAEDAIRERFAQIADYYEARRQALAEKTGAPYRPLPPDRLYLSDGEWAERASAAERATPDANVFDALAAHARALQADGKRVASALWSEGARERMRHVLPDHGFGTLVPVRAFAEVQALAQGQVALAVLGIESG